MTFGELYSNIFIYRLYVGICLLLMLIYSGMYMLLAIYIERINPGEFGVAQSWNYLFKKSFWIPHNSSIVQPSHSNSKERHRRIKSKSENQSKDNQHWFQLDSFVNTKYPALVIDHLTKVISNYLKVSFFSKVYCIVEIWKVASCFRSFTRFLRRRGLLIVGPQWSRKNNDNIYTCR